MIEERHENTGREAIGKRGEVLERRTREKKTTLSRVRTTSRERKNKTTTRRITGV